jgi:sugar-specific transcriptional regulator TrmB
MEIEMKDINLEDHYEKLEKFGLSPNQAKTYLTLVRLGKSTAKGLWQNSDIPREEVYRKLKDLQEMGFVEKILSTPRLFRAIPLKTALEVLLRKKSEELSQLQLDSEVLMQSAQKSTFGDKFKNSVETIVIPKQGAIIERAKKELLGLKKSLDCVLSWEKADGWFSAHYEIFEELLKRNVQIRWIIGKREDKGLINRVKKLPNSHLFEVKEVPRAPEACFGIYDGTVLLLDTSATSGFIQTSVLWSNNPSLIKLSQNYFDTLHFFS